LIIIATTTTKDDPQTAATIVSVKSAIRSIKTALIYIIELSRQIVCMSVGDLCMATETSNTSIDLLYRKVYNAGDNLLFQYLIYLL